MPSIEQIRASDGTGNAQIATIQSTRAAAATTIDVDTVAGFNPDGFMASMGTPHTFVDPVTSEEITVISEATAVDFSGHVDGSNLEIDDIAPGYTDAGSAIGDIVIVRPTTQHADNVADTLAVSHDDDGTMKKAAIVEGLDTYGTLGVVRQYTANDTWSKPAGIKFVIIRARGGGGGGGGVGTTSGAGTGAGGGSGELSFKKVLAASLGSSETVTVGAGGAGGIGNNQGATGSTTSFGAHCTALGGVGGLGSSGLTIYRAGGSGGTGGTADFAIKGNVGQSGGGDASSTVSGAGGGEGGGQAIGSPGTGNAGVRGGGGGGALDTGTTSRTGGAGGAGWVTVEEYY